MPERRDRRYILPIYYINQLYKPFPFGDSRLIVAFISLSKKFLEITNFPLVALCL